MRLFFWIIWFFVFTAAINTGNNLFYLVFSVCTAFMLTPRYAAMSGLKNIKVSRSFPYVINAGSEYTVPVAIANGSKSDKFFLKIDESINGAVPCGPDTIFCLKPFSSVSFDFKFKFASRGPVNIECSKIYSKLPLLMKEKSITIDNCCKLIVFPKVPDVKFKISGSFIQKRSKLKTVSSYSDDFAGFKNYQTSDTIRKINWHHYVVTRDLFVAKYEQTQATSYNVILFLPADSQNCPDCYEAAISAAAGIISTLIKSKIEFKLITVSGKIMSIDSKYSNLNKIMTHLALLSGTYNISRNTIHKVRSLAPGHSKMIVVTSSHFNGLETFFKIHEETLSSALIFKNTSETESAAPADTAECSEKYARRFKSACGIYELSPAFSVKAVNL